MTIRTFDITGMGDEYEQATQKMVWAGVEFFQKNRVKEFTSSQSSIIYGIVDNQGEIGKRFDETLIKASPGCTGAMLQCATDHAMLIYKRGYKHWVSLFEKDPERCKESFDFEFDGEVDLINILYEVKK